MSLEALMPRYLALWQRFVPSHPEMAPSCLSLCDEYAGAGRPYHNLTHLADVLAKLDWARAELPKNGALDAVPAAQHPRLFDLIEMALFYHDVIYDAKAKDNEAQSRDVFIAHAKRFGMAQADIDTVARLIDVTAKHTTASQLDEQILCDCDLAILGADPETFAAYDRNIRNEYAHVPAAIWDVRRPGVLKHFYEQPRLFKTDLFHETYDAQARTNLKQAMTPKTPVAKFIGLFRK